MIKALLLKEWIKLRRLAWVAPVLVLAAVANSGLDLKGAIDAQGAAQVWATLTNKRPVPFAALAMLLPLAGLWIAALQFLPEYGGRRLRLTFHLPAPHRLSLRLPLAVGLACVALTLAVAVAALAWVLALGLGLPAELTGPMLRTLAPWGVAAMVAYLAGAATIAAPRPLAKAALALAGLAHVAMLSRIHGYGGLWSALPATTVLTLPWLLAPEAAALRVKEGD